MDFIDLSPEQERLLDQCAEHYQSWRDVFLLVTDDAAPGEAARALASLARSRWGIQLTEADAMAVVEDTRRVAGSQRHRLLSACAEEPDRWRAVYELADSGASPMTRIISLCRLARSWGIELDLVDASWFFGQINEEDPVRGAHPRAT